jgi:hypothetical protein
LGWVGLNGTLHMFLFGSRCLLVRFLVFVFVLCVSFFVFPPLFGRMGSIAWDDMLPFFNLTDSG